MGYDETRFEEVNNLDGLLLLVWMLFFIALIPIIFIYIKTMNLRDFISELIN